jgi:predicted nuclease of predicted toxin-antitoxin system
VDLLADGNQHPLVVARLRDAGYSVEFIIESSAGAQDGEILSRAEIGTRILLTYDRDFGDLIFHRGYPAPFAILYTRLNRAEPDRIAERLLAELEAGITPGHMTTITDDGVRLRPFPGASHG